MKTRGSNPAAQKWQRMAMVLLLAAIFLVAAAPGPDSGRQAQGRYVCLMESDYSTPFLGSYKAIRALPFESRSFAFFAGYEQHSGQYNFRGQVGIASVTGFAGPLFEATDLEMVMSVDLPDYSSAVYVSEQFWREKLGGNPAALGELLTVSSRPMRIAGVLREAAGLFAGTDIWLPMCTKQPGVQSQSLRLVGKLRQGVDLTEAQKELARLSRKRSGTYHELRMCRLVSAEAVAAFEPQWTSAALDFPAAWPDRS